MTRFFKYFLCIGVGFFFGAVSFIPAPQEVSYQDLESKLAMSQIQLLFLTRQYQSCENYNRACLDQIKKLSEEIEGLKVSY